MSPIPDLAQAFVKELADDLKGGYHIVPFLGAGFSLSAGYPTTKILAEHLIPYWIVRGLGLNPFANVQGRTQGSRDRILVPKLRPWSPIDGWWPSPGEELLASDEENILAFTATKASDLLNV